MRRHPGGPHPAAPDFRGLCRAVRAVRSGSPVPQDDPILTYVERIEQCGDRIIDMGGGTIADARADGTAENGVHEVSAADFTTPIHVAASYEDGVFILRPVGIPGIQVTRRLDDAGRMIWTRPDLGAAGRHAGTDRRWRGNSREHIQQSSPPRLIYIGSRRS